MTYRDQVFAHSCETMAELPDGVVQTCVTSPPYWGLRKYGGEDAMIGLEETPEEHLARIVAVFREVKRVLRDDGTLWLNYGDAFNAGTSAKRSPGAGDHGRWTQDQGEGNRRVNAPQLKPKDLIGLPWMVAFALRADGWYLRSDIIWHKPNPMPESVTDRPTRAHEYIFLLTKKPRYYYDAAAIREPIKESSVKRISQSTFETQTGGEKDYGSESNRSMRKTLENFAHKAAGANSRLYVDRDPMHERAAEAERKTARKQDALGKQTYTGFNERYNSADDLAGANKRDVWTVATAPYREAHFATYPPELIRPCILAGSRPGDLVLDPFMGSGTTAQVAEELARHWVGYEVNPAYVALINERVKQRNLFKAAQ